MEIVTWNKAQDHWLGVGDTNKLIFDDEELLYSQKNNLLAAGPSELAVLTKADYIYFATKFFLNVTLFPFQAAMLKELLTRPFPLLLMSRGGGKTYMLAILSLIKSLFNPEHKVVIAGAGFRQSKQVFENIEKIWDNAPMLRSICSKNSGPRHDNDRWTFNINNSSIVAIPVGCLAEDTLITTNNGISTIKDVWVDGTSACQVWDGEKFTKIGFHHYNGIKPTMKVETVGGYSYIGTYDHKMKIVRDNNIVWEQTENLVLGDRVLIDLSQRWASNPSFNCSIDQAYCLGLMLGDGNYTNKYFLRYTTKDKFFLQFLNKEIGFFKQYDDIHYQHNSKEDRQNWMSFWGLTEENRYTLNKKLPSSILSSSKEAMRACLQGLFDSDGTISVINNKGGQSIMISFTNISKSLIEQIHYILTHFGIYSSINSRMRKKSTSLCYDIIIRGIYCHKFYQNIGFRLPRKQNLLEYGIKKQKRLFHSKHNIPIDKNLLLDIIKKYPLGSRFSEKDIQNRKNITKEYLQNFINKFIEKYNDVNKIEILLNLNNDYHYDTIKNIQEHISIPTYDIHVPEHNTYIANGFVSHNTGEKIRGLRAHTIVADEFASHSPDIYETVIAGFGSVSNDVVGNVQKAAAREILIEEGMWDENAENEFLGKQSNQSIITGTASYSFNHFYDYYKKYKGIIESRGDVDKLREALNGEPPEGFNWKDYSIMRIPFSHMPPGFMDAKTVGRAKATVHTSIYLMEYECCFCEDSDGFFKRSLIEFCTASEKNVKKSGWPSWCPTHFEAVTRGDLNKKYVFGIDPAFQQDNFAITVLEVYNTHARIVYVWTVNKNKFMDYIKAGLTPEHDYYQFCSRKIRDLMQVFPPLAIGIDAQGGGRTIEQALHDNLRLKPGELPLWPVIEDKPKETDDMPGLHILHMVQFSNQGWTADANYGLLNDLQGRTILFPHFDQISLELAAGQDLIREKAFQEKFNKTLTITDSLEDCVLEIEELKEELASIRMSYTGSGVNSREKWSTPEVKLSGDRKGYLRKDRYSSLIIANSLARLFRNKLPEMSYECYGGIVRDLAKKTGVMYTGPEWATSKLNSGKFGVLINANNKNQ